MEVMQGIKIVFERDARHSLIHSNVCGFRSRAHDPREKPQLPKGNA